jgi:hypothetical protein
MEIKVAVEHLQKQGIFLATPMYGGACAGIYTRSVADLVTLCTKYNIPLQIFFLFNESLITRARNYCCDEFMRSTSTHLMFIDSDIGFDAQDVIALLAISSQPNTDYDVIGGPYPKKNISWEKIKAAVDKGVADKDPNVLEKFVGDFVFNPKGGTQEIRIDEPAEVLEIGTGFMLIRKEALKTFQEKFPQYMYKPDHVRTEHFDGTREIMQFFQAEIDPVSKRYLSEDYWFCQKLQEMGLKTYLCPWMKTQHVGSYVFGGSLPDLASIGVAATADESILKKNRNVGPNPVQSGSALAPTVKGKRKAKKQKRG